MTTAKKSNPGKPQGGVPWQAKAAGVAVAAVALLAITFTGNSGGSSTSGVAGARSDYPYVIGTPGPGEAAPAFALPSTDGTFELTAFRGQNVLLFFQEGIMCPACWDQVREIEANWNQFQDLGIERMFQVTTDPLEASREALRQYRLRTPIMYDAGVKVSRVYETNKYGMMGDSMNGHSFILVDKEGVIRWRADYGGAPKYTMYVPLKVLMGDLKEALGGKSL
jgi:peroxiredoxin